MKGLKMASSQKPGKEIPLPVDPKPDLIPPEDPQLEDPVPDAVRPEVPDPNAEPEVSDPFDEGNFPV